jgi:hypothetical protein
MELFFIFIAERFFRRVRPLSREDAMKKGLFLFVLLAGAVTFFFVQKRKLSKENIY